jgi:sulfonate transport system substrate-binding protein
MKAPTVDRRQFLQVALSAGAALTVAACRSGSGDPGSGGAGPGGTIGTSVPKGTSLRIASSLGAQKLQLDLAGLTSKLSFEVPEWPNIGAGPDVINAYRANSLDVGNNAGIPPIQAHFQQLPARIVAVNQVRKPAYVFATKPGSDIASTKDFAGRKLAFSRARLRASCCCGLSMRPA